MSSVSQRTTIARVARGAGAAPDWTRAADSVVSQSSRARQGEVSARNAASGPAGPRVLSSTDWRRSTDTPEQFAFSRRRTARRGLLAHARDLGHHPQRGRQLLHLQPRTQPGDGVVRTGLARDLLDLDL